MIFVAILTSRDAEKSQCDAESHAEIKGWKLEVSCVVDIFECFIGNDEQGRMKTN